MFEARAKTKKMLEDGKSKYEGFLIETEKYKLDDRINHLKEQVGKYKKEMISVNMYIITLI